MSVTDIVDRFRSLLQLLLGIEATSKSKRTQARRTLEQDRGVSEPIEISLYQTQTLSDVRDRVPETMVARQFAHILDKHNFDYRIEIGYPETYDPPVEQPGNNLDVIDWWQQHSPERSADCNLLLVDAAGGGRGGDVNQVYGARGIETLHGARGECNTYQCARIWAAIHELCHGLGGKHTTPMMRDKPTIDIHPNMVALLEQEFKSEGGANA